MTLDDDLLMAYADGELDAAERQAVAQAVADDPALAARVAQHQALRRRVAAAVAPVADEPVPDRLLAALAAAPVVDLAAARAARGRAPAWPAPRWALAACLVVGVLVGVLGGSAWRRGGDAPFAQRDGRWVAQGALAQALALPREAAPAGADATVALSFAAKDGGYCRVFAWHAGAGLSGLACQDAGAWRIELVARGAPGPADGAGLRPAGSAIAPEVLRAVDARIAGEALDVAGERAAQAAGWRR